MKYQDSIEQASEKAALTAAFLQRHRLAAHPVVKEWAAVPMVGIS